MNNTFIQKIYYDLLYKYKKEVLLFFGSIISLEVLSIFIFSYIVSFFLKNVNKNKNYNHIIFLFFGSILLLHLLNNFYKYIQFKIIVRIREDVKLYLSTIIFESLNKNYINDNYLEYYSPMIKLSYKIYVIIHHLCSYYIPYIVLTLLIIGYLFYYTPMSACIIILSILIMFIILKLNIKELLKESIQYEKSSNTLDYELLESFGNIDKIINRNTEYIHKKKLEKEKNETIQSGDIYYNHSNKLNNNLRLILNMSFFMIVVYLFKKDHNDILALIIPLLLLYKGKADASIERYTDTIEVYGKLIFLSEKWNKHITNLKNVKIKHSSNIYDLNFDTLNFKSIHFYYGKKQIFKNYNLKIDLKKNKIIGLFGKSGTGKSTLMKLLIKNYKCSSGNIYIDGTNINDLENSQLRQNIIYIGQNLKLFDTTLTDNILYGCNHDKCKINYEHINKDEYLKDLFHNENFSDLKAGSLGENISGGQNQMINIINGLINTSKILILDEPTRNLDPNLKNYLKQLITQYKNNHKNIIIITHDNDFRDMFNQIVEL